jgi:glutamate racemase
LISAGADQVVLACTHFPFLAPLIREIVGDDVTLVEPSEPVARQVSRVSEPCPPQTPTYRYFTSGDVASFNQTASILMKQPIQAEFIDNGH